MKLKEKILSILPATLGKDYLVVSDQSTTDIIREVVKSHKYFHNDYLLISDLFDSSNDFECLEGIFDFLKENVRYKIETDDEQTTKSPARLLIAGYGDCKHYAGFVGGVVDCLGFNWCYRFASYNLLNSNPSHVFVVVFLNGKEIWIDPVLNNFNSKFPIPISKKDINLGNMALKRLSGIGASAFDTAYQNDYGSLPDYSTRINVTEGDSFWTKLLNTAGSILGGLLGGGGSGSSGSNCPPCPTAPPPTMNDLILPAAIGFGIAYFVKKKKK